MWACQETCTLYRLVAWRIKEFLYTFFLVSGHSYDWNGLARKIFSPPFRKMSWVYCTYNGFLVSTRDFLRCSDWSSQPGLILFASLKLSLLSVSIPGYLYVETTSSVSPFIFVAGKSFFIVCDHLFCFLGFFKLRSRKLSVRHCAKAAVFCPLKHWERMAGV